MRKDIEKADFDFSGRIAGTYEDEHDRNLFLVGGDSQFFYDEKIRLLHRHLPFFKPEYILDFGCGRGRLSDVLKDRYQFSEVIGVDISEQSIDIARQRVSHPRVQFFLQTPNKKFDLIIASGVFHHIEYEEQAVALKNIALSLAPGAFLVLFEHNPLNPLTRYIVRKESFEFDSYLITPKRMKNLVLEAGLSLRCLVFTAFFPSFLKAFARLDHFLARIPLGGQYMVIIQQFKGAE